MMLKITLRILTRELPGAQKSCVDKGRRSFKILWDFPPGKGLRLNGSELVIMETIFSLSATYVVTGF